MDILGGQFLIYHIGCWPKTLIMPVDLSVSFLRDNAQKKKIYRVRVG